jgi:hypothetical protein
MPEKPTYEVAANGVNTVPLGHTAVQHSAARKFFEHNQTLHFDRMHLMTAQRNWYVHGMFDVFRLAPLTPSRRRGSFSDLHCAQIC